MAWPATKGIGSQDLQDAAALVGDGLRLSLFDGLQFLAVHQVDAGVLRHTLHLLALPPLGLVVGCQSLSFLRKGSLAFFDFGFGPLEVHEFQRDFLPVAPLDAVETHAVALHLVFTNNVIVAVLQVQLQVGGEG